MNTLRNLFLSATAFIVVVSVSAQDQDDQVSSKKVYLQETNGKKTLTIVEDKNGKKTETVYRDEEADMKLAELRGEDPNDKSPKTIEKEVTVEEINGEKRVVVMTSTNGRVVKEVFTGVAADRILNELEQESAKGVQIKKKVIEREVFELEPHEKMK